MHGYGDDNTTTNHFALNMPDQGFNENYFYPTLLWASLVADSSDLETIIVIPRLQQQSTCKPNKYKCSNNVAMSFMLCTTCRVGSLVSLVGFDQSDELETLQVHYFCKAFHYSHVVPLRDHRHFVVYFDSKRVVQRFV